MIPKYIRKGVSRHRIRISRGEAEILFSIITWRLVGLNNQIEEYEKLIHSYERKLPHVTKFPPREGSGNMMYKSYQKVVSRMKELEPVIAPKKLLPYIRLYDKLYAIIGRPMLKAEYIQLRDDLEEWIRYCPSIFREPKSLTPWQEGV